MVKSVVCEVNLSVVMVETKPLLLTVVSKVDFDGLLLLDPGGDDTVGPGGELRVKVSATVVVRAVICVVERFVAIVVTRLEVIVSG